MAKRIFPGSTIIATTSPSLKGLKILDGVKSVATLGKMKGVVRLPDNSTIAPQLIIQYGNARRPDEVREWVEQ